MFKNICRVRFGPGPGLGIRVRFGSGYSYPGSVSGPGIKKRAGPVPGAKTCARAGL